MRTRELLRLRNTGHPGINSLFAKESRKARRYIFFAHAGALAGLLLVFAIICAFTFRSSSSILETLMAVGFAWGIPFAFICFAGYLTLMGAGVDTPRQRRKLASVFAGREPQEEITVTT